MRDELDSKLKFVRVNLVMIEGRRPSITLICDNLYIVREIVSIDVNVRQNYRWWTVG